MGIIYFAEDNDRVKIGFSSRPDPERRLREIDAQAGCSLRLIGSTEGTLQQEKTLHHVLWDHKIRREWYRNSAELRHIIDRCLTDLDGAIKNPDGATTNFAKAIRAMWPEDPAGTLAERAKCTRMQAYLWLAGIAELPAYLVPILMREWLEPRMQNKGAEG